ncbi:MAG: VWA domain-containing protein, partial [Betaproteobacteria bacterium]|nr:VWA domain-containing protein [Betaproteobacteria bacterium]
CIRDRCLLCIAMARPQAVLMTPLREATVMLALDTSGSMRAKDLKPSRIEAAQQAALKFIESKPARLRVGSNRSIAWPILTRCADGCKPDSPAKPIIRFSTKWVAVSGGSPKKRRRLHHGINEKRFRATFARLV